MSRIFFHSPSGDVHIRGIEGHYFRWLCNRMLLGILNLRSDSESEPHPLRKAVPDGHYTSRYHGDQWAQSMEAYIRTSSMLPEETMIIDGREADFQTAALNTALVLGGDCLKFAARLCGQCEIHAFVEGKNRAWLANILETGLRQHILRADMGWLGVIEFLRASQTEPVVTSSSLASQFPNVSLPLEMGAWTSSTDPDDEEAAQEQFDQLPERERWDIAMGALRIHSEEHGARLELKPDDWQDFHFNSGITAFDIMHHFEALAATKSK